MTYIGLDIGGANLKAADADGRSASRAFPLWKTPERLAGELAQLLASFPQGAGLAVTMTGELADCFSTKAEGVDRILRAVEDVAAGRPVYVWQTGAEFVAPDVARDIPRLVAAANWHALATWLGRMLPAQPAVLIDIGTTTTDIIPLLDGVPVPQGLTDCERLQAGELVYMGVRRTPLCALAATVPFRGANCPLAAELFATTLDVYLILGTIAENPADCETANGRPATIACAHDRLARMLCCDRDEFTLDDAAAAAASLFAAQQRTVAAALERVLAAQRAPCRSVLLAGSGAFLAERIVAGIEQLAAAEIHQLTALFDAGSSEAACALAVARLAAERIASDHFPEWSSSDFPAEFLNRDRLSTLEGLANRR